jgi:hypothetical protein
MAVNLRDRIGQGDHRLLLREVLVLKPFQRSWSRTKYRLNEICGQVGQPRQLPAARFYSAWGSMTIAASAVAPAANIETKGRLFRAEGPSFIRPRTQPSLLHTSGNGKDGEKPRPFRVRPPFSRNGSRILIPKGLRKAAQGCRSERLPWENG